MTSTQATQTRSGLVTGSRWMLVILAALFTLGAFTQFFLVGVSFFDDASRWNDHATFGAFLGLLTYFLWIPAVLGKTGARVIIATVALLILFGAQHASISIDNTMVNALHPLNGSILLVLGWWVTQRSLGLARERHLASEPQPVHHDRAVSSEQLGRRAS
ncbi:MAG TPA: DUF6220 domain-containing protein [Thermomicrobiales bacterium]|nr:DUF6220 domain-containing protein [Thermomicrobiales bacterium]